jgi:rare lipoprotein A
MKVGVRVAACLMAGLLVLSGCGKKKVAVRHPRSAPKVGDVETGVASWYGKPYHGRAAADGEIYDMEKLTAAHRTLAFNTWVRVENLANRETVDLRIIDRGPFVGGRVIDVSHAAAIKLGMIGTGIAKVRLVVIKEPAVMEASMFAVQVGLFQVRENADKLQAQTKQRYGKARVVERTGSVPMWRVLVGEESSAEQAESLAVRVRGDISVPEAFVVRLDRP